MDLKSTLKNLNPYLTGLILIIVMLSIWRLCPKTNKQQNLAEIEAYNKIISSLKFLDYRDLDPIEKFHKKFSGSKLHKDLDIILKNRGLALDSIKESWTVRSLLEAKKKAIEFYEREKFIPGTDVIDYGIDAWGKPLIIKINPEPAKENEKWIFSINSTGPNRKNDQEKSLFEDDDINIIINEKEFLLLQKSQDTDGLDAIKNKNRGKSNNIRSKRVTIEELLNKK